MRNMKKKIEKILKKTGQKNILFKIKNNIVFLNGEVKSYERYLEIGKEIGKINDIKGVVNNIIFPNYIKKKMKSSNNDTIRKTDIVIIGGGVIGCSIARELSKYNLQTLLIEKSNDVGCGTTKANNAMVHTGIGEKKGTLKQKLCIKGYKKFDKLSKELKFPYRKNGLLILLTKNSLEKYKIPFFISNFLISKIIPFYILFTSKKLGLTMNIISKKKLMKIEPKITKDSLVALYSPTYGITCPYLFTIALAENSIKNGLEFLLNTEVIDIETKDNKIKSVITNKGIIKTKFIVNAAGLYADEIADMANAREYTIRAKKGATLIFDKNTSNYINHNISIVNFPRDEHYKGGGAITTLDGNIQWGPTITETSDKFDTSVTSEDIENIIKSYSPIFNQFPKESVINYFSGLRACTFTEDFIIKSSKKTEGFIHVAGIQSPGLTAAPAISEMVVQILKKDGLKLEKKSDYNPYNKKKIVIRNLNDEEKNDIIKNNPDYGEIICRCEQITKGEVLDAIHPPLPALNIDSIKRRTRIGMGRCQGGFCLPNIVKIISDETDISGEDILKNNNDSNLFIGKSKCLIDDKYD
jgi:glycerol-3-phosphate dehydrogenase